MTEDFAYMNAELQEQSFRKFIGPNVCEEYDRHKADERRIFSAFTAAMAETSRIEAVNYASVVVRDFARFAEERVFWREQRTRHAMYHLEPIVVPYR